LVDLAVLRFPFGISLAARPVWSDTACLPGSNEHRPLARLRARRSAARVPHRVPVGIHLGEVVEESDGDLMGDGVNIAARLEASRTR